MVHEFGVSDLIQAEGMVDDGVIALKDGGLLAGWRYRGTPFTPQIAPVVRNRIASLLDQGKGWVLETNAIRLPSTVYPVWGTFPDPVSTLIETERKTNYTAPGRYFETQYYLTLSYFPPSKAGEKAKGWFYESPDGGMGPAEQALEYFRGKIAEFETLAGGLIEMHRLKRAGKLNELLRYIQLCISGEDKPFLELDVDVRLDYLLGGLDLCGGTKPLIGGKPVRVLAIDPLPDTIYPAMLQSLEHLDMPYRLNGRTILLSRAEAAKLYASVRRGHEAKKKSFFDRIMHGDNARVVNKRAAALADEAETATSLSDDRTESFGHFSARVVLVRDTEEEMDEAIKAVRSCAEESHLKVRVETFNANECWCASLPGHFAFDIRQVPIRALNVAGMSPLHSAWLGHQYNPSPKMPPRSSPLLVATAVGKTQYRHNLHVQDVGHTAVFGPTGAGKTILLGLHALSLLRYPGAQVAMFDRGRTQYVLCKALGGKFYDFGANTSLQLCPLQVLETPGDLAWASNYIETLCEMNGLQVTSAHRDRIGKTVSQLSRGKYRSLTHFAGHAADLEIQAALQFYTVGNAVSARLLDGETDSIADSHFTVFEMSELMQMNPRIRMAVQRHLFRRVERKLDSSRITGIFLDEARRMIGDELFVGTMESWLKEIRNLNGFVVMALQEIEDSAGSRLQAVIQQQCQTKIFLPNPGANSQLTREGYKGLGLDEYQIGQVAAGRSRSEYFISNSETWSRITFDLSPVALAFLGASNRADRELADRLMAGNPEGWQGEYLRSRGQAEWADYYEILRKGGVG